MARKSRELRTTQTLELIKEYEADNLHADYRYRFINDVYIRLVGGKHLTARQRTWLDSLIKEGVPKINRDNKLINQIQAVIDLRGMEHRKSVLRDFLSRLVAGKQLTEKQASFLTGMLKEANKVKADGPYEPSESTRSKLSKCVLLSEGYSTMYWQTHPGTARAISAIREWIEGSTQYIDEWSVNKTIKAMGSKLRELENPYVSSGDLVWCKESYGMDAVTGVVSGCPEITKNGKIVYPILSKGTVTMMEKTQLTKRSPRKSR